MTIRRGGSPRGGGSRFRGFGGLPPRASLPSLPVLPAGTGTIIAPAISIVALMVIAAASLSILNGRLPSVGGNNGPPIKTPTPSNIVVVDPRASIPGKLVYIKDGNLWLQSGAQAQQITTGGNDAMPTWSADGQWIYFIRTTSAEGRWPANGVLPRYDLEVPALVRMHPDGTGLETLLVGKVRRNANTWASFLRQPFPNPSGTEVAVITDGPDPTISDLVLKILDLTTGGLVNLQLTEIAPLGHQDPAWSPDGSAILFAEDARSGTRGAPVIERYDIATKHVKALTGPGYLGPAWSPDGRYVAATNTGSFGTDIVILDARSGAELLRVTSDELSFDPVWSPAGDSIAFFRVDHGVVDLELAKLVGAGPSWTVGETIQLTLSAGLDAGSRASWFVPPEQLPTAPPNSVPSEALPTQAFPTLHSSTAP